MELKFKNALYSILYLACFASICVIFCCALGICITYFFENARDFNDVLFYGAIIILTVWLISGLVVLLNKTVIVTENEIRMYRGKKLKWSIKKEEIQECIYNEMKWYYVLFPISTINAFALQFRLKGKKSISKEFCSLSLKQVRLIQETFNYPIRGIQTIYEQ